MPQEGIARKTSSESESPHSFGSSSYWNKLTDSSIRWQVRVDMLRRLDKSNLTTGDTETLYQLLNHRPADQQQEAWWVVVNEIMEQMRKQAIGSDRYTDTLLSILGDDTAPVVLRDYAVQHLGQWICPRGVEQANPHETDLALIQEAAHALGNLVVDPDLAHTSIPGTTLAVLADMQGGGVSEATLSEVIERLHPWLEPTLKGENSVSQITRSSALNAVGALRLKQYRPVLSRLAGDEKTDSSLRLSSIAALGQIGAEEDLSLLQSLASGSTKYRFAAATALNKLTSSDDGKGVRTP